MKKVVYILLTLAIVFAFASCKNVTEEYEQLNPLSVVETTKLAEVLSSIYDSSDKKVEVLNGEYSIIGLPVRYNDGTIQSGTITSGSIYWEQNKLHIDFYFTGNGTAPSFTDVKTVFTGNSFDVDKMTVTSIGNCSQFLSTAEMKGIVKLILGGTSYSFDYAMDYCNDYVTGSRTVVYSFEEGATISGHYTIATTSTLKATYMNDVAKIRILEDLKTNVAFELKATVDQSAYVVTYTPYKNVVTFADGSKYLGTTELGFCLCCDWL